MTSPTYGFQKLIEASYNLQDMMGFFKLNDAPDMIERTIVRFKDLRTLYAVTRGIQAGMDDYHMPLSTTERAGDFKRDGDGFIYTDTVIAGIPFRLTTLERNTSYSPVFYTEMDPATGRDDEKITLQSFVMFNPETHVLLRKDDPVLAGWQFTKMQDKACREPGVKRCG